MKIPSWILLKRPQEQFVVDEGHQNFGTTAEIAARISEKAFYFLDAPVVRMGAMDVPIPFSPVLEDLTVPTAAVLRICQKNVLENDTCPLKLECHN